MKKIMASLGLLLLAAAAQSRVGFGLHGVLKAGETLPPFPTAEGAWLWSPQPQTLEDPEGRFGVLFVWRQGLLEARHSLIWLSDLAKRKPELRVISMHAPRYDWERDLGRLGSLQDYEDLSVPVLWDSRRAYWRAAGFRHYPTVVLFDPRGRILWFYEGKMKKGERPGQVLDRIYEEALETYLRELLNGPASPDDGGVLPPLLD